MIDWTAVGGAVGMVLTGVLGWLGGKGKREVSTAQDNAQIADYRADQATADASAKQIQSLMQRVTDLESKYSALWDELQKEKIAGSKLRDRVHQLESILRNNNIPVPAEL
jgi:hypothetical protein